MVAAEFVCITNPTETTDRTHKKKLFIFFGPLPTEYKQTVPLMKVALTYRVINTVSFSTFSSFFLTVN